MAQQPPNKPLTLEVEIIENGFLLIRGRLYGEQGTTYYCADETALAEKIDKLLRFWCRMKTTGKQRLPGVDP